MESVTNVNINELMEIQDSILREYCHLPIITVTDISKHMGLVGDMHYQTIINNNYIKGYVDGIYYDYCPSHKLLMCRNLISHKLVQRWLNLTKIDDHWLTDVMQISVGSTVLISSKLMRKKVTQLNNNGDIVTSHVITPCWSFDKLLKCTITGPDICITTNFDIFGREDRCYQFVSGDLTLFIQYMSNFDVLSVTPFVNAKQHGLKRVWNNIKQHEADWALKQKEIPLLYQQNKVTEEINNYQGLLHGKQVIYDNGRVVESTNYDHDVKHGWQIYTGRSNKFYCKGQYISHADVKTCMYIGLYDLCRSGYIICNDNNVNRFLNYFDVLPVEIMELVLSCVSDNYKKYDNNHDDDHDTICRVRINKFFNLAGANLLLSDVEL